MPTRRAFATMALAAGVCGLGYWQGLRHGWFSSHAVLVVDLVSLALPLAAAGACFWRAGRLSGRTAAAWRLVGLACAGWALGQAAWAAYELGARQEVPSPSLADAGYLSLIPLAGAGLLTLGQAPGATTRLRKVLDGAIIASSLLFVSGTSTLGAALRATQEGVLSRAVLLAYPLGDVILATLALTLLSRARPGERLSLALLSLGILAISFADSAFLYLNLAGTYSTGSPVDAGWVWGFQLIGLAAVAPRPATSASYDQPSLASAWLPLGVFAFGATVACLHVLRRGELSGPLFWLATTVVLLVAARTGAFLRENLLLRNDVEAALQAARAAASERTKALRAVSHDLNNPLTPIQLQLGVLRSRHAGDEDARTFQILERNLAQIRRLVEDLRDLARIEGGRLELHLGAVDLGAVAREACEAWRPEADRRGVRLEAASSGPGGSGAGAGGDDLTGRMDPQRVRQVLDNLLSNALKFTEAGGEVRVRASRGPANLHVEVTDSGRGLSPSEAASLFQPFTQVHDRERQAPADRGMGLGLSVCKGILDAHGGRIGVRSDGLGRGSTFWFDLPASAA